MSNYFFSNKTHFVVGIYKEVLRDILDANIQEVNTQTIQSVTFSNRVTLTIEEISAIVEQFNPKSN